MCYYVYVVYFREWNTLKVSYCDTRNTVACQLWKKTQDVT